MPQVYKDEKSDEYFFGDGYILSETDEHGIITYANELFCEVANYKLDELIGQPHNIVRHPDMPRVAFKGLWDDIQSKGFWSGLVVNKRRISGYYWVFATVIRMIDSNGKISYLSIRTTPNRSDVLAAKELYAKLRAQE